MAKQEINFGTTINDGTGDTLRNGAQKINNNFSELYNLLGGAESIGIVSKLTAGDGLVASSPTGDITISTLPATSTELGSVIVGTGINLDDSGAISVTPYSLPKAATNILGGIRVGDNLTINNDGVLSADASTYSLPTASPTVKGGVRVGNGLEMVDGVLNVVNSEIASALQSDNATLSYLKVDGQDHSLLQSNFGVSLASVGDLYFTGVLWTNNEDLVNQITVNALGTTILHQNILEETSTQWRFRPDGILAGPTMAVGTLDSQDQIISLVGENNITFGNKDLISYIRIEGPDDTNTDNVGISVPRANTIRIISNNIGDFVNGLGPTSPGRIILEAGGYQNEHAAKIYMGQPGDSSHNFPPTGEPVVTTTNSIEVVGGVAFYGDVTVRGGAWLATPRLVFADGTIQTTAYQGESPTEITINRLTNGENEVILDAEGVLTVVGTIYSTSSISVESITDTSISAGTDLKLYSSGLFALRNYSDTESIVVSTRYGLETEKNWLFNTNGTITFPDATVQTTAYVSNITNTSVGESSILTPDSTMSRGYLSVRIVLVNTDEINVEFNYANPDGVVSVSGNNGTTNFFNGSTVLAQANTVWTTMTTTPLVLSGDSVTALISDQSFGKFYRITAMYRDLPEEGTIASVYCIIEELA